MNTTQLKIMTIIGLVALLTIQETSAQNGMDYAVGPTIHFSRLHKANIGFLQNIQNEKAMGVYNADILPSSTLEINTTTNYLPFLHPNLGGDRGLVFRSVAPAGFTQQWQMFRDNNQMFRLFNPANSVNTVLEATQPGSSIIINTNGTNERARFNQDGNLEVRTPFNEAYPPGIAYDANGKIAVHGAIFATHLSGFAGNLQPGRHGTILYGATNMLGPPTGDGFRIRWDNHFFANFNEALIFEKTDFNQNFPNGGASGIAFVNTGNDDIVRTAMVIKGNGRVGIGNVFGPNNKTSAQGGDINGLNTFIPKAILDVYSIDTSMVVNLRLTQTPHAQPNNGIFSDLQTTGSANPLGQGNLLLNPRHATDTGFVGINMYDDFSYGNNHAVVRRHNLSLDVNGQQNLRWVEEDTTGLPFILVWDSLQQGRIKYRKSFFYSCSDTVSSKLPYDSKYDLNDHNFYFTDRSNTIKNTSDNRVAIGVVCSTPLKGKLEVIEDTVNTNHFATIAGRFENKNKIVNSRNYGVWAECNNNNDTSQTFNVGVLGAARNATRWNSGGWFLGNTPQPNMITPIPNSRSYGSYNVATNAETNIGVYGTALGLASSLTYAAWFDGDVYVNGGGNSGTGYLVASDANYKTNLDTISNALGIIEKLQPKSFFFDTANTVNLKFSSKKQYGFIAQAIEPILPELVSQTTKPAEYDSLGNMMIPKISFKTLNYNAFIAILTKGMQQQNDSIQKLDSLTKAQDHKMDSLENALNRLSQQVQQIQHCINQLCGNNKQNNSENNNNPQNNELGNTINVELSNGDAIVLEQNVPNPFAENTSINYYIPKNNNYAQLIFTDMHGRIIKTVDIKQSGKGQLKVYAANLSQGVYQYSIVVDGKIIDTKKMLVEK
ncbi:MAG: T9SS type A sorting domain-containing protein [Bacteroidetes bacterium]|nr:T9SS C-terminal target domain-containing protein [Bacteroidota bacterium]NOG94651.1 T9SS type A sorting domain-containing protein [Bacteroidota bacterium]